MTGEELISPPVANSHFLEPSACNPYNFPSAEPIKIVPSAAIAGEESTLPEVRKVHNRFPCAVTAMTLVPLPTNKVPSEAIAGDELIAPSVSIRHFSDPPGLTAKSAPLSFPM